MVQMVWMVQMVQMVGMVGMVGMVQMVSMVGMVWMVGMALWYNRCSENGGMAEWFKAPVLKTGVPKGTGGSTPSPSARFFHRLQQR